MLYSWTFLDKKERGKIWYMMAFSLVIGLVIWGFITAQYGMSFVILLVAGLAFYVDNNAKDEVNVEVGELGIKVGENFYDYSKIRSFTIIYEGEYAVILRLMLSKKGISILDLNIDNTVAGELKQILPNFITENEKEDLSFTDKLIRILKL